MKLQQYDKYSTDDHKNWNFLYTRQKKIILEEASSEFQKGFKQLNLTATHVQDINALNKYLYQECGWVVEPVTGLVPLSEFLQLLINHKFPVNPVIRNSNELEFSELPDIFHDLYGHVPMLLSDIFNRFICDFAKSTIGYAENAKVADIISRFYWFSLETGLIKEENKLRPYGGAILTSASELANISRPEVLKAKFETHKVVQTEYSSFSLQKLYFYITSYDDLFEELEHLKTILRAY
ncbi:Phenylalanine-4-hydroxylase [compost metagenome]